MEPDATRLEAGNEHDDQQEKKMRNHHLSVSLIFALAITFPVALNAQAPGSGEMLSQYVSDLQKHPDDAALREKIIRHVQSMKKPPAIPEEARRHYVKALTYFEDATLPSDSADAAEEFRKALLIAPWWSELYMKRGLALETAQRYDEAIASLKLFMLTNPQGEVLRKTQDEIYKIEAKQERAAKDSDQARKDKIEAERRQQAAKAEEDARAGQRKLEDFYRRCDGRRYVLDFGDSENTADLRGRRIILGSIYKSGRPDEIPSNMQLGVWKEMWDLKISNMEMAGGMLVLSFDDSNNNWMYSKAYLNEYCEIKFASKVSGVNETNYYRSRGQ
jgi:tetratricopeptide (TPR) repeat protein